MAGVDAIDGKKSNKLSVVEWMNLFKPKTEDTTKNSAAAYLALGTMLNGGNKGTTGPGTLA